MIDLHIPLTLGVVAPAVGLAIAAAMAAAQTGLSIYQAQQQNKAIKRSQASADAAAAAEKQQAARQLSIEQIKIARESRRVSGRIRVAATQAGSVDSGSFAALDRQNLSDAALNTNILIGNYSNTVAGIDSHNAAVQAQLQSQHQNLLVNGLAGGIRGFQTGLSIASAIPSAGAAASGGAVATTGMEPGVTQIPDVVETQYTNSTGVLA